MFGRINFIAMKVHKVTVSCMNQGNLPTCLSLCFETGPKVSETKCDRQVLKICKEPVKHFLIEALD